MSLFRHRMSTHIDILGGFVQQAAGTLTANTLTLDETLRKTQIFPERETTQFHRLNVKRGQLELNLTTHIGISPRRI